MTSAQPADESELADLVELERIESAAALSHQNDFLRQTIALFDRLTTTALAGADVAQIAHALSSSLGQAVVVLDANFEQIAAAGFGEADAHTGPHATGQRAAFVPAEDPLFRQALETAALKHLPLRLPLLPGSNLANLGSECILAPIAQGDELLGFLAVTTDRGAVGEDLDLFNVQHAATIFALALLQEHRDEEMRARYKRELVEGLFVGQPNRSRAAELAILVGLVPDVAYWVLSLAPADQDTDSPDSLLTELARSLDEREPGAIAVPRQDHVAVLVPASDAETGAARPLEEASAELRGFLQRRFPERGFILGASAPVPDPSGLGPAIEQARRAMAVARRLRIAGEVLTYADLGVHRLLLHVPESELRAFADDVLGALSSYDAAHHAALVETLETFLGENENLRRTAERLYVHVNTVNYRIRRIEQLAALDLNDAQQRLIVRVALESRRLLEPGEAR